MLWVQESLVDFGWLLVVKGNDEDLSRLSSGGLRLKTLYFLEKLLQNPNQGVVVC